MIHKTTAYVRIDSAAKNTPYQPGSAPSTTCRINFEQQRTNGSEDNTGWRKTNDHGAEDNSGPTTANTTCARYIKSTQGQQSMLKTKAHLA